MLPSIKQWSFKTKMHAMNYNYISAHPEYKFGPQSSQSRLAQNDTESVFIYILVRSDRAAVIFLCTGRNLDEQLAELTRQVFRLPEVESVLQKAGLHSAPVREPKPAVALFIKVRTLEHALHLKTTFLGRVEFPELFWPTRLWADRTVSSRFSQSALQWRLGPWSMLETSWNTSSPIFRTRAERVYSFRIGSSVSANKFVSNHVTPLWSTFLKVLFPVKLLDDAFFMLGYNKRCFSRLLGQALEPPVGHHQSSTAALPHCRCFASAPRSPPAGQWRTHSNVVGPQRHSTSLSSSKNTKYPYTMKTHHIRSPPVKWWLSWCFQGLSVTAGASQSQGAYVKQQLHSVINQYLSRFLPATPSTGAVVNHPVLLAACESTSTPQGQRLRRSILQVLRYWSVLYFFFYRIVS